jgi:HlyD family secretion protein
VLLFAHRATPSFPEGIMGRRPKFLVGFLVLAAAVGTTAAVHSSRAASKKGPATVEVVRATLVDKALAVGTIQPATEISIKSRVSGVVARRFVEVGDFVAAGAPLLEIRPDPAPLELAEARRQVELHAIESDNLQKMLERAAELRDRGLQSQQEYDTTKRNYDQAALQVQMAKERLALMEKGRVRIADQNIESIVTAPVAGSILDKKVEVGDPVVALSSYQEGTVLLSMADMKSLVFRGKVDEIDVGRLVEGMPVDLKIGALPAARVHGTLDKIWLKATKEENATSFPVEIRLTDLGGALLRAGYSANADVVIQKRDSVIAVPERVVTFAGDSTYVTLALPGGKTEKRLVQMGLSDAIQVEVLAGLVPGDRVLEKPSQPTK